MWVVSAWKPVTIICSQWSILSNIFKRQPCQNFQQHLHHTSWNSEFLDRKSNKMFYCIPSYLPPGTCYLLSSWQSELLSGYKTQDPRHNKQCKQSSGNAMFAPAQVWTQYRQHQSSSSAPDWQPPAPLLSLLWLTGPLWRNFRNQPMNGPQAFLRFCTHFLAKVRF